MSRVKKTISILEEHDQWIRENHIKLSSLVQEALEKAIKERPTGTSS